MPRHPRGPRAALTVSCISRVSPDICTLPKRTKLQLGVHLLRRWSRRSYGCGHRGPIEGPVSRRSSMKPNLVALGLGVATAMAALCSASIPAQAQQQPNIVVIMGDDIGIWNIGAYHQGMMAGRTPNLDKLAAEGMRFTDYYAEASCTAGRANFITGELPIRTG